MLKGEVGVDDDVAEFGSEPAATGLAWFLINANWQQPSRPGETENPMCMHSFFGDSYLLSCDGASGEHPSFIT
jgi:hypothetical protein